MIKIKDYIFNENEITHIVQKSNENLDTDYLIVYGKDKNEHKFITINATFEDIEWNYGNNISESLSYDLAKARVEELEEENKKLKDELELKDFNYTKFRHLEESNDILKEELEEEENKIDKAIEYMDRRDLEWGSEEHEKMMKILKGEEND